MYTKVTIFDEITEVPHYRNYGLCFLVFCILLLLFCLYPYTKQETFVAKLEKQHFLMVVIPTKKISLIDKNKFYYANKVYGFKVESMEMSGDQNSIVLVLYLNKKIESKQNIIWIAFDKKRTTIMEELIKKGKRGFSI
ncbi:MAG: hypothetical protein PHN72_02725 [Bacilli bacterium]|nr:hypothetical protein [Bacilli bacterium]